MHEKIIHLQTSVYDNCDRVYGNCKRPSINSNFSSLNTVNSNNSGSINMPET